MAEQDTYPPNYKCWSAWLQDNFTAVALFVLLIISLTLLILLMHESSMKADYTTWMEGFTAGVFSAWTLSLKSAASGQHQGDTISTGDNATVNQTPAVVVSKVAPRENPAAVQEPKPDLPVFANGSGG